MLNLLYILLAIVMLGFIVTVHEFGHYLVGRLCGIGIIEFSVGFGPRLCGFTRKDIQYSLRAIPLGGYCRFVGEDEENSAPNAMNNQPVWKRFLTVLAGPFMNFVLAFIFCVILLTNFIYIERLPKIDEVSAGTPAAECGIEVGDIVQEINGVSLPYTYDGIELLRSTLQAAEPGAPVTLTVLRGDETLDISVTPARVLVDESTGETAYQIGIVFGGRTYPLGGALKSGVRYMVSYTGALLDALKDLVFHGDGMEDMRGTVGIISMASHEISTGGAYSVVNLIFFLSLNIGIMNLLPLPALDGGRLVFLIIEAIRRKPVPPEKEGLVHAFGLGLLLMLFLFLTYKDILRLFTGG